MAFDSKPKFVTFDMNGTLIHFRINDAIRRVLGDRLPPEIADDFQARIRRLAETTRLRVGVDNVAAIDALAEAMGAAPASAPSSPWCPITSARSTPAASSADPLRKGLST